MSKFETKEEMAFISTTMVAIGHELRNLWIHPKSSKGYCLTSKGFRIMEGTDKDDLIKRFVANKDKAELKRFLKGMK